MITYDPAVAAEAQLDAERIRTMAWGSEFPVDPVRIARRLGIDVLQAALGEIGETRLQRRRSYPQVGKSNSNPCGATRRQLELVPHARSP